MTILETKLVCSVPEAMQASNLGRNSIYNAIKEGKLVAKKYGNRTLIEMKALEAFIASLPNKA